jgi:hypothetical protein
VLRSHQIVLPSNGWRTGHSEFRPELAIAVAETNQMSNGTRKPKLNPIRALSDGLNYFALFLPGGVENMIFLARLSEDEKVQEVARRWNAVPRKDRKNSSLDELCKAACVDPGKFLGVVAGTAYELGIDVRDVMTAIANLDTMPAHMDRVVKRGGFRDRQRIFQSSGIWPRSDGPRADQPPVEIEGLPSFEEDTIESTRFLEGW